ncbi:unnamed protein product, partial [Meganyctiphanes norvegica]
MTKHHKMSLDINKLLQRAILQGEDVESFYNFVMENQSKDVFFNMKIQSAILFIHKEFILCDFFLTLYGTANTGQKVCRTKIGCNFKYTTTRKVTIWPPRPTRIFTAADHLFLLRTKEKWMFHAKFKVSSCQTNLLHDRLTKDSGVYECQVATMPKISRKFELTVNIPVASITGSREMFMKAGSNINITCVVSGSAQPAPVLWYHAHNSSDGVASIHVINFGHRGGVQMVTNKKQGISWLLVTRVTGADSGNYTCAPQYAVPASVYIHILDEELPAAMQHDPLPNSSSTSMHSLLLHTVYILTLEMLLLLLQMRSYTRTALSFHMRWPIYYWRRRLQRLMIPLYRLGISFIWFWSAQTFKIFITVRKMCLNLCQIVYLIYLRIHNMSLAIKYRRKRQVI